MCMYVLVLGVSKIGVLELDQKVCLQSDGREGKLCVAVQAGGSGRRLAIGGEILGRYHAISMQYDILTSRTGGHR